MKADEFTRCAVCGAVLTEKGIHFWRVKVEQFVFDPNAIRRAQGLQMMLGSPAIAAAMGPDEDLAVKMSEGTGLLCAECGITAPAVVVWNDD